MEPIASAERIRSLVSEHGTPVYITNTDIVQERYDNLQSTLNFCTVKFATKSNFDPQVISCLDDQGAGFVCGSSQEAYVAVNAGVNAADLQVTAVSPKDSSIEQLVELSNQSQEFTVTLNEYQTAERLLDAGYQGNLLLRLSPNVELQSDSKYKTGAFLKFGLSSEEIGLTKSLVESTDTDAEIRGFHSHLGGSFNTATIDKYISHIEETIATATEHIPLEEIDVLNFGGGLGIPYRPTDTPLDTETLAHKMRTILPEDSQTEYVIEPGRYIVSPSTILVTKVQTTRSKDGKRFVGVDASMAEFPRTTMFDVYHHIRPVDSEIRNREVTEQTIAGPTCSGADIFASQRELPLVTIGDLIQIENVGAYGFVMANHFHAYSSPTVITTDGIKSPSLDEITDCSDAFGDI